MSKYIDRDDAQEVLLEEIREIINDGEEALRCLDKITVISALFKFVDRLFQEEEKTTAELTFDTMMLGSLVMKEDGSDA